MTATRAAQVTLSRLDPATLAASGSTYWALGAILWAADACRPLTGGVGKVVKDGSVRLLCSNTGTLLINWRI